MIKQLLGWMAGGHEANFEPAYRVREVWSYAQVDSKTHRIVHVPVLVFRKAEDGMFWGLPLANVGTKQKPHYVPRRKAGKKVSVLSHMRTLRADRLMHRLGTANEKEFAVLADSVVRMLAASVPTKKASRPRTYVVRAPRRPVLSPFSPLYAMPARV